MLHVCHAVMYKQLSAWLLHGLLLDYYDEFFIMVKSTTSAGTITSAEQPETEDGKREEKQVQVCVPSFLSRFSSKEPWILPLEVVSILS